MNIVDHMIMLKKELQIQSPTKWLNELEIKAETIGINVNGKS
jgi:hypothetical protein